MKRKIIIIIIIIIVENSEKNMIITTNIKFLLKLIKIDVNIRIDFWHVLFPNQLTQSN